MVICSHSSKYKVLCSLPQRKLVFFDYCFTYFVVHERTSIISNTSIEFRHIRWRKRHSQIKKSLQIPAGIETASIVLSNRMLQFLRIYGKNECDSVIRKIVLDSLQKFYSETRSTAIRFIHKNDEAISPFIEKRIKKVFYLFLNAFCFFISARGSSPRSASITAVHFFPVNESRTVDAIFMQSPSLGRE